MKLTNVATQVESSLARAERWLENERDKPISCLILRYQIKDGEENRGWSELPELYRKHFETAGRCGYRIGKEEYLEIAYHGEMAGWKELFGTAGEVGRQSICIEKAEYLQHLNPIDRWSMIQFHLIRSKLLGDSFGGRRMNLDSRFNLSLGDLDVAGGNVRFSIDQSLGGGLEKLPKALKESADNYGFFATINDLRSVSVAALQYLRHELNQRVTSARGRKSRRKRDQSDHQQDWVKVFREYETFSKPPNYKKQRSGNWTAKFEAFWQSRQDLQAWSLKAAWEHCESARKRIDRRSR